MGKNAKTRFLELENGARIIVKPIEGLRAVTVEAFVDIGSKRESPKEWGISHFLEHMAFKGTKKRPGVAQIGREIDAKGASYNAGTGQELTSYFVTTTREGIDWANEILADIVLAPKLPGKEVEKEKGVIVSEIKMYRENPTMGLGGEFLKMALAGSDGCWDVAGEEKTVRGTTRDDLAGYRKRNLNGRGLVVVVAGDVGGLEAEDVGKRWQGLGRGEEKKRIKVVFGPEREKSLKREVEQGHVAMGVPGLRRGDKRKYALKIMETILVGNSSSRLHWQIRDKRGWAYYIYSLTESFAEAGIVGIQTGVEVDRLEEVKEIVCREFVGFSKAVRENEISRAKDYIIGKTRLAMDRSEFWSGYLGQKMLLEGRVGDPEEELKRLKAVTWGEVKDLAAEVLRKEEIRVLTVCGK